MITVSLFSGVGDTEPKPIELPDFYSLTSLFATAEQRGDKLGGNLFAPTSFGRCPEEGCLSGNPKADCGGGRPHRLNATAETVFFGVLDFDDLPDDIIDGIRDLLAPYEHIWHSTWSHGRARKKKLNRYRAILKLSRPLAAEEWHDFWPRMAARFGAVQDRSCRDPARFYFLPAVPLDQDPLTDYEYLYVEGEPFPVDAVLLDPLPDFAKPPPKPTKVLDLHTYEPSEWAIEWANQRLDHYCKKIEVIDDAAGPMHPDLNEAAFALGGLTPHLLDPLEVGERLLDAALLLNPDRAEKYLPIIAEGIEDGARKPFAPEPRYAWTDTGNAHRLVDLYKDKIRYIPAWRKWLVWDEDDWHLEDNIQPLVEEAVKEIHEEANQIQNPKHRADAKKFALSSENLSRRRAAETLASTHPDLRVGHDLLDADPWLLGVANGTLDLRTGELRKSEPTDYITKRTPVAYDPQATAPLWEKFLLDIFDKNEDVVAYIQAAVGYSMTAHTNEHKLFFLYGTGLNGKSTFVNTLLRMLGDYAAPGAPSLLLQSSASGRHPTEIADLYGLRMVSCQEVEEGRNWNEVLVKQLTGADPVKARRMNEDFWGFLPTHKFWISGNHTPPVRGTDEGIWRRMVLVPFDRNFKDRADKELPMKLLHELPGILRWGVEGALLWQKTGLQEPPKIAAATTRYRRDQDQIGQFLEDRCALDPVAKTPRTLLRRAYENWCEEAGEKFPWSPRAFNSALRARGFKEGRMDHTDRTRVWAGIRLLPTATISVLDTGKSRTTLTG